MVVCQSGSKDKCLGGARSNGELLSGPEDSRLLKTSAKVVRLSRWRDSGASIACLSN